jgi:hypothetical protein
MIDVRKSSNYVGRCSRCRFFSKVGFEDWRRTEDPSVLQAWFEAIRSKMSGPVSYSQFGTCRAYTRDTLIVHETAGCSPSIGISFRVRDEEPFESFDRDWLTEMDSPAVQPDPVVEARQRAEKDAAERWQAIEREKWRARDAEWRAMRGSGDRAKEAAWANPPPDPPPVKEPTLKEQIDALTEVGKRKITK